MTILLKTQLENVKNRYETLSKTGRGDMVARIVLDRMEAEIKSLERSINSERRSRQEVNTRTSSGSFTQGLKQAFCRYWFKCNTNNYSIPAIPASETL